MSNKEPPKKRQPKPVTKPPQEATVPSGPPPPPKRGTYDDPEPVTHPTPPPPPVVTAPPPSTAPERIPGPARPRYVPITTVEEAPPKTVEEEAIAYAIKIFTPDVIAYMITKDQALSDWVFKTYPDAIGIVRTYVLMYKDRKEEAIYDWAIKVLRSRADTRMHAGVIMNHPKGKEWLEKQLVIWKQILFAPTFLCTNCGWLIPIVNEAAPNLVCYKCGQTYALTG